MPKFKKYKDDVVLKTLCVDINAKLLERKNYVIPMYKLDDVVPIVFECIADHLKQNRNVQINNFGSFYLNYFPDRYIKTNYLSNKPFFVKSSHFITFKASKFLKKDIIYLSRNNQIPQQVRLKQQNGVINKANKKKKDEQAKLEQDQTTTNISSEEKT